MGGMSRDSPPLAANLDPRINDTMGSVLGLITVIILKRERVFSFKARDLQHVSLKIENSWQNL